MTSKANTRVLICGAGPVGLTAALVLCRRNIPCLILERRERLNTASKASTFHPPTLEILEELGLLGQMLQHGRLADRIQFRHVDGTVFAEFNQGMLADDTRCPFRLHLEQSAITPLLLGNALDTGLAEIRFGAEVASVGTDGEGAWAELKDGSKHRGAYLIGTDGAHSAVRGSLGIPFTGEDYPGRVLRLMVRDDLNTLLPGVAGVSYLYTDDHRSISLLEMPDCWRVIIRVPDGISDDTVTEPDWYCQVLQEFIPASKGKLSVIRTDIYSASKMLAGSNQVERVALAGDAVHLTNTRGGMNMNCGIHDAYILARAIENAIRTGSQAAVIEAQQERFRVARDELLPRTDRNVVGKKEWLSYITEVAADGIKAREYLLGSSMIDISPSNMRAKVQDKGGVAEGSSV